MNVVERRGELIQVLENALGIAEELGEGNTEYLIERAPDEAGAPHFRPSRSGEASQLNYRY